MRLLSQLRQIDSSMLCEIGQRPSNQDCCVHREIEANQCWVMADGLGGHNGGEVASQTASTALLESFEKDRRVSADAVQFHLSNAQKAVQKAQAEHPDLCEMRTTVVMLITDSRTAIWAHVGDSRLYWFRDQRILAQTEDHSVPQSLVKAGEIKPAQIRHHIDRGRLLKSLGEPGPLQPAILPHPVRIADGDAFLLCTDGFWENILETEMQADLSASSSANEWLVRLENRLLRRMSSQQDNYSAVGIILSPPRSERSDTKSSATGDVSI